MDRLEEVLATIRQSVLDTADYRDVMRFERLAYLVEQGASGPDRATLVSAQTIEALRERPGGLAAIDGYMMLITTGRATPCKIGELVRLQASLEEAIGRNVRMAKILHQEDLRTDDHLNVALLIQLIKNPVDAT